MRATGIIRRIDDLGRLVIPAEIRRMTLKQQDHTPIEMFVDGRRLILEEYIEKDRCAICESFRGDHIKFKEKVICHECISELKEGNNI